MSNKRPLNERDLKISSLYRKGFKIFEIVKAINGEVKDDAVRNSLIKQGLWKSSISSVQYDMDLLLNLHTNADGWYLIGLLLADGSVSVVGKGDTGKLFKKVTWEIDKKDETSLVNIRDHYAKGAAIYERKTRPLVSLTWSNTTFVEYLEGYGVQVNKRAVEMPTISPVLLENKIFAKAFLAGYFDGDGCISIDRRCFSTKLNVSAATPVWEEVHKVLDFVGFTYSANKSHNAWVSCTFNNPSNSLALLIDIYNTTDLVFIRRKERLREVLKLTLQSPVRYKSYIDRLKEADVTGYFLEGVTCNT